MSEYAAALEEQVNALKTAANRTYIPPGQKYMVSNFSASVTTVNIDGANATLIKDMCAE